VSIDERDGLHTACWQNARSKTTPRFASLSRFGVFAG
jgi:hypothetical protein